MHDRGEGSRNTHKDEDEMEKSDMSIRNGKVDIRSIPGPKPKVEAGEKKPHRPEHAWQKAQRGIVAPKDGYDGVDQLPDGPWQPQSRNDDTWCRGRRSMRPAERRQPRAERMVYANEAYQKDVGSRELGDATSHIFLQHQTG